MFKDKILKTLIQKYPPPNWTDRTEFLFEDLIETIINQQLSGKAADSIFTKFKQLFNSPAFPTPKQVFGVNEDTLRTSGLSGSKAKYIHNVARAFTDNKIEIKKIRSLTDEEVIEALTQIKGIGRWSAEMILIFILTRPDVFSIGDLGLRNAIENLYGIKEKGDILTLAETWSPNRSTASWYLWRSLENHPSFAVNEAKRQF